MSFLTDGIGDAFDFIASPLEDVAGGIVDIAEAAVEGVEEIGELAVKMSKVLVKSLVIAFKLIAKVLPLAELAIYAAPTFALIYTYSMALNTLKDIDLGETYEKFRPKINQLLILSAAVLEWWIYNVDGLGWSELYPSKDSSMDMSLDFGVFGISEPNVVRAQKAALPTTKKVNTQRDNAVGVRFTPGDAITSSNSAYKFVFQGDGNAVLVEAGSGRPLWQTNTRGKYAVMQNDGNFVVYDGDRKPAWQSKTAGNPGAKLQVQNDANLVIVTADGDVLWSTNSARKPEVIKEDVVKAKYDKDVSGGREPRNNGSAIVAGRYIKGDVWVVNANLNLLFQLDGNLVLLHNRKPVWQSGTHGRGHTLNFQPDANLTIQDINQNVIWATHNLSPPEKAPFRVDIQASDTNIVIRDKFDGVVWSRF